MFGCTAFTHSNWWNFETIHIKIARFNFIYRIKMKRNAITNYNIPSISSPERQIWVKMMPNVIFDQFWSKTDINDWYFVLFLWLVAAVACRFLRLLILFLPETAQHFLLFFGTKEQNTVLLAISSLQAVWESQFVNYAQLFAKNSWIICVYLSILLSLHRQNVFQFDLYIVLQTMIFILSFPVRTNWKWYSPEMCIK